MKEFFKDVWDGLKHIFPVALAFVLIALIGSSLKGSGWVIPFSAAVGFAIGWFARRTNTVQKKKLTSAIVYGLFGLAAGILWFVTS